MAIEGDLRNSSLAHVLESVAAQGKSGILTVQGSDDIVAVSFLDGEVVSADALNQTVEDGLGTVLAQNNLVRSEDFSAVSREHQGGSTGSLGDLLVSRGLIGRDDLLQALRVQTYQLMLQILLWQEGEFKFYAGNEISFEEGFKPLPVEEILVRSISDLNGRPGSLPGPVPQMDLLYRQVPPRGVVKIFGTDGEGDGDGIWLTTRQVEFMNRLDGRTAVHAVAASLNMREFPTLFALYKLLQHDLVEVAGAAASATSSKGARRPVPAPAPSPRSATSSGALPQPFSPSSSSAIPRPGALRMPAPGAASSPPAAEIFTPPGRDTAEFSASDLEAPVVQTASTVHRFIGPVLAIALLFALVLTFLPRPGVFLMPFPWQKNQRNAVHQHLRQTLFGKIEQANRAYFLVQAHYPESLKELVDLGLLSKGDLRDPAAYVLSYANDAVGYRITLLDRGETVDGLGAAEALRNDFLLNPRFLRTTPSEGVPLVLID